MTPKSHYNAVVKGPITWGAAAEGEPGTFEWHIGPTTTGITFDMGLTPTRELYQNMHLVLRGNVRVRGNTGEPIVESKGLTCFPEESER